MKHSPKMLEHELEPKTQDPARQALGARLKAARQRSELTQDAVAKEFHTTKGTVSAWETGRGIPNALDLCKLARLYEVSTDTLLTDDALSPEGLKFARQFDALDDNQRRAFKTLWIVYFAEAHSDSEVERRMPITRGHREHWIDVPAKKK